jgi:hypothetical protein
LALLAPDVVTLGVDFSNRPTGLWLYGANRASRP